MPAARLPGSRISRRHFLALTATVVAGACSDEQSGSDTSTDPDTRTSASSPASADAAAVAPSTASEPVTSSPATPASTTRAASTTSTTEQLALADDPFRLGVASGDPDATSVVLWTRLVGELPAEVPVTWELLDGERVVSSGEATATVDHAHAVHVVVEVDRPLTYRFRSGGFTSSTGRAGPAVDSGELRIAAASCQHYETGYYAAFRDIAEWQPDVVLHLGDFIYEGAARPVGGVVVRTHDGPEATDLASYRSRYAHYLGDADLRAARSACPWLVIWDDHEVENNYAGLVPQDTTEATGFSARRADAFKAWWEHTPTRLPAPQGEERYEIYRGVEFGQLARVSVLDGRQFRTDQACGDVTLSTDPPCDEVLDPGRTMLGTQQEAWLVERFATSAARWNVVGQQTIMTDVRLNGAILNYDQWDGYPEARDRILAAAPPDLVVITGDIHLAGVGTLGGAGVEFVTTAISSTANVDPSFEDVVRSLDNIVDADLVNRGYTRHTITPERWVAEYRIVDDIASPTSTVSTWKTFTVDRGTNRAVATA
jgi:alkaline phosphatase D